MEQCALWTTVQLPGTLMHTVSLLEGATDLLKLDDLASS